MARPRTVTDAALLTAAGAAIGRLGPGFRLADVAAEAGVAVGTVALRFGSKHGLLVAMMRAGRAAVAELDAPGDAPGDASGGAPGDASAAVELLVARYAPLDDPVTAPHHLAALGADLADDELRGLLADLHEATAARVETALLAARDELPGAPDAAAGARLLVALADGTAAHWSARPAGRLTDRLRTDLTAVLDGWRTTRCTGGDT